MAAGDVRTSSFPLPETPEPPLQTHSHSLIEAPILLLLQFHKALRQELADLHRIAVHAFASVTKCSNQFLLDVHRRFKFLKLFQKYHSASEDEVIFLGLDVHIKNVVSTYSLEHESIDELFESIFHYLDLLIKEDEEDEDIPNPFQELVFCIGTMETTICQHMLKEEKQVFPLLMEQFSSKKQASLVWQFMCSVPIILLEEFLPWMTSFLSPDERMDYINGIKEVVPNEYLLQEVVISWFGNKEQTSFGACSKGAQVLNFEDILKICSPEDHFEDKQQLNRALLVPITDGHNPVDGIKVWHSAIRKDLDEILQELFQVRRSNSFSTLGSVIVQLKFFADLLIFYSNALDKIFYPLWIELANDFPSLSYKRFLDGSQIEDLQRLLYSTSQPSMSLSSFVEKLCVEMDSFLREINKHLKFLEAEIFPYIRMKCSQERQQLLLYTSLQMMPLGLLKYMIIWFSTHLSDDESKSILYSIKRGPLADKSLASLVCEWVRVGYSGKTSVENFRKDLKEMFDSKSCFSLNRLLGTNSIITAENNHTSTSSSSSGSITTKRYDTLYSSAINLHVFFPQIPLTPSHAEKSNTNSFVNLELSPMDHILFFHKALRKDLENLVILSTNLAENLVFLPDFHRRFRVLRYLYQMHSDSEDDVAFPALEAKGAFRNISDSYGIDHKLEVDQFNKISQLLDEISKLPLSISNGDQRLWKYRQMCAKLHNMCLSMQKTLFDHIKHEEIELWPLFREHFSVQEQMKIIGCMLGRIRAEVLQEMIPWLMASLTREEQQAMMSLWRKATKNTMFNEWLDEWWVGINVVDRVAVKPEPIVLPSRTEEPLEVIWAYFSRDSFDELGGPLSNKTHKSSQTDRKDDEEEALGKDQNMHQFPIKVHEEGHNDKSSSTDQADKECKIVQVGENLEHGDNHPMVMNQEELVAAIRKVSHDFSLDPEKKPRIIQNMHMSRWISAQQNSHKEVTVSHDDVEIQGQFPSYRDPLKSKFGCKHYKRNCKLLAFCCNKLYACRYCHDADVTDHHTMDRKATMKMMCMKCLTIQPIGPKCSTVSCHNLSMAKYYCKICKFFDDEREIYHCPYCNLCRVGRGLGIDYFHCMNCNACMSRSISSVHICREKCFEDFCPICHEFMFTSSSPINALPCGHLMHSSCFQEYTCTHYICPVCCKSLGDMQVYFGMIDALLAEQKMPDEYADQTQVILCNDCTKRGTTAFHWLYHKCPFCGSYNTRVL